MRATRPYTYLGTVRGMCRQCRALVPARVIAEGGAVYQERLCPQCGPARTRIADDVAWYRERTAAAVRCKPARQPPRPVRLGCPHDCGPCAFHANACHLPVFSVTNVCDLTCPICFTYNRPDRQWFMSREELRRLLDAFLERNGPVDLINLTGGEPTLHPGILDLLAEGRRTGIGRVTLNTNGLRLARDEEFCRRLAELEAYVILSFDTLQADRSVAIHGRDLVAEKQRALENLQRHGVGTTLLNVMIRGINEDEIGAIVGLARSHSVVRSVMIQTMTYTGRGGGGFLPRAATPLDGAVKAIERATHGELSSGHFFPHPGAHPLCYSVAYYFKDSLALRSFTDYFRPDELREMFGHGYLVQPDDRLDAALRAAVNRLWANGEDAAALATLRRLLDELYPPGRALTTAQRQVLAEEQLLTVYVHAHMDEDTLDLARLVCCPDQVPDPEGRLIPACAYNLFYRQQDPRFWCG